MYFYYLTTYDPKDHIQSHERIEASEIHSKSTELNKCGNILTSAPAQTWAQQQSSNLFFHQTVASSLPTIIMTYFLGLYTHRLGRKFVLLLTIFGNVLQYFIWLMIIHFKVRTYLIHHLKQPFLLSATRILVVDCRIRF